MPFVKIPIHQRNLEVRKKSVNDSWKIPIKEKKYLLKFLEDLGLGKVNKGKKISEGRQLKYLDILKIPLEFFNKESSKLTLKDIENFEKDLTSNKIKSFKDKPYEHSTKADMRRMLKIYLKWKLGTSKAEKLAGWLDTKQKKKTPNFLSEEEIIKLFKSCRTARDRFIISGLFDSGARAEEFFNIRYSDVQLPNNDDNYIKLTIKEEYSKTKGRTISLYWKYSLESFRDYLRERECDGIRSDEPLMKESYDNIRMFLYRLGKKVLNKSIHPHLFRHSSATYYADKLNRQQLCYRYGWAFSSNMPDVYISRAGMENRELDNKLSTTKIEDLKEQLEREKFERNKLKEDLEQGRTEREQMKNVIQKFMIESKRAIISMKKDDIIIKKAIEILKGENIEIKN